MYFKLKDKYFARLRPDEMKASQAEEAVNARLKMQLLGKLAKATKYVTPIGLANRPKRMSSSNFFISRNYGACSVADGVASIDYSKLVFADGSLMPPIVTVSYSTEDHALSFQTNADSENYSGCWSTDKVYAVVLDSEHNHCKLAEIGTRGEGGLTPVSLHPNWKQENIHAYVFAADEQSGDVSVSTYLPVETA